MSFNTEALIDGRGRALRIDGSLDKFSSITYRWGSVAGVLDGTNQYSNRILSIGAVRRGLGQNRVAGGGTCELVLANADGAYDALFEAIGAQAALRLRVYVCLWTPGVSPPVFTSKLLGEFSLTEWIRQNNETLTFPLGDDVMGAVAQQAALPTLQDWHDVGGSAATNPLYDGFGIPDVLTEFTPVQLAFGEDWVSTLPHILPFGAIDADYERKVIVPVCSTSDTGAVDQDEITNLRIHWFDPATNAARLIDVPRTVWDDVNEVALTNWLVEKSPTITKDGKTFQIIYLVVRDDLGALRRDNNYITGYRAGTGAPDAGYGGVDYGNEFVGGYAPAAIYQRRAEAGNWGARTQYGSMAAGALAWYVKGFPFSARAQTTSPVQHPVDVVTDLVSHYSNNTALTINTVERERVRAASASAACAGTVQPWTTAGNAEAFQQPPSLRQIITAICQSADFDCFIDWSGQFSFSCDFWDFRIATSGSATWTPDGGVVTSGNGVTTSFIPTVIPEMWLAPGLERWWPSDGERWAPFNRLFFNGGKANPGDGQEIPFQGPWDFDTGQPGAIPLAYRIIEATLEQGWRPYRQQAQGPWSWRSINTVARAMVRFRTHIGGLQLELGQYFALSWTRGPTLAGPYSGTIFQCEAITYAPGDDTVEITAVWRHDITTERQYVLDDEDLLVVSKAGGASTLAVTNGAPDIFATGTTLFDNGMGVMPGDILILRDRNQAADEFALYRCFRIEVVAADDEIQVTPTPTATNLTIADADWSISHGATTYPTFASDPTNYPLGGDQYGKVTDAAGLYSNAATGNRLISG